MTEDSASKLPSTMSASPKPAAGSSSSGPSGGSARRLPSEQKTVISKRSPLAESPFPRADGPGEIGKALESVLLGHFRLEQFIGGGGMGAVFRAVDTMLGRTVAVKVVSSETTDEETLRRFRNEAQSAARLDHPNIARVYYVGEDKSWNYIVFEYIEGVNIRDLVGQKGPLPVDEAISYTLQVAEALEHASQRDVVHRDIKPSNILVMPDGRAKLVDMGLARLHQVDSPSNDLTASGVTLGTFDYISPEQARDPRSADVRSDLYSLGCTLYFMLTGQAPFPEGTVLQKLLSHSSEQPPDPRDVRSDLPEEVSAIALTLMAKQPSRRFQRPNELVGELLLLSDKLGLDSAGRGGTVWVAPRESWLSRIETHIPWVIPVLALIAVVVVLEAAWREPARVTREEMRPRFTAPSRVVKPPLPPSGEEVQEKAEAPVPREPPRGETPPPGEPPAPPKAEPAPAEKRERPAEKEKAGGGTPPAAGVTPATKRADDSVGQDAASIAEPPSESTLSVSPSVSATLSFGEVRATVDAAELATAIIRATPPPDPTRLVVGTADAAAGAAVVGSLEAAFQKAAELPELKTIELRFNQREERPLTLAWNNESQELTIRAGEGFTPLVLFRPKEFDLADERRMINLVGGRVHFSRVHFRVELPDAPAEGWSLFHLNQTKSVSLTGCTMTMQNDQGSSAAFFAVQGPRTSETMIPGERPAAINPPFVELDTFLARGQATLVRAVDGLPFWLHARQGLFSTTERLVEAAGFADHTGPDVARIELSHVTASMGRGMCRVDIRDGAPILPELIVDCKNCVLVQDGRSPLVEHVGVESVELAKASFTQRGEDNLYEATKIRWRILPKNGEPKEFSREPKDEPWYEEKRSEDVAGWRSPRPVDGPVHTHTPGHYLLEANQSRVAGFDEQLVPAPPAPRGELPLPSAATDTATP